MFPDGFGKCKRKETLCLQSPVAVHPTSCLPQENLTLVNQAKGKRDSHLISKNKNKHKNRKTPNLLQIHM